MLHAPKLSQVELVLVFSHYSVVSWVFLARRLCFCHSCTRHEEFGMLLFVTCLSVSHRDLIVSRFRLIIMAQVPHLDFIIKLAFLQLDFDDSEIIP